jgi:hypothetical protein
LRTLEYRPERDGIAVPRTWDYRPERDGVATPVPLLQRAAQPAPPPNKAADEANAARAKMFEEWDKNPQREIDAGRFFREKVFGAKRDKSNILQDPIGLYDPQFSETMRDALRQATPEEIGAITSLRPKNPADILRIGGRGGRIDLTPQQRSQFVNMIERAGPDGQKVGAAARRYWGMEKAR